MASVKKITTAKGEARYRLRYRVNGRSAEEWFRTLTDAKAKRAQVEGDTHTGGLVDPRAGALTLDDYLERWLEQRLVKGRPLAAATVTGYGRLYKRNVADRLGQKPLRSLRPDTIRSWHADVVATAGHDQAAKSYRMLRAVLTTAEADELIRQNPCRIRGGGEEHAAERPMVETALVLRLADVIEARYRPIVLLAGFGGLRTGESLGLVRADVDLLHRRVRVDRQAQEVTGRGRVTLPPKSEAGRRLVALPRVVTDALEEHLAAFTALEADSPLFTGPSDTPLRRATLSKAWRLALVEAKAPADLRPHDLRHHAATLTARMPGVTTKELMARIGHASPRAALLYQHATEERDQAIAGYLDDVVASASAEPRAAVVDLSVGSRGAGVGLGAN